MNRRRFAALTVGLVALNLFLWLAPAGLAVRTAFLNQFFGPRMVRAEVVMLGPGGAPQDFRIDRGVVTAVTSTSITLSEADGTTQTIPIASTTRVDGRGRGRSANSLARLPRNARVLVVFPANGPAQIVQVEGRGGP